MAKAVKPKSDSKKFEFSKVGGILDNIAKTTPIHIEKETRTKSFISTGVYMLDAAISGRLIGGGILNSRIFCLGGESGSGKSFLAYSVCKNAQRKDGYSIIYIDTEYSIELEDLPKYGIDTSPDKFRLIRSNKVEDVNIMLSQLIDELKEVKKAGGEIPKMLFVLDSVGQMSSTKEKADLLAGDIKVDFTKAKALGSLFRSINNDLGYLEIPMLVCNHTYETMEMFSQTKLKGGNALYYTASVVAFMTKAKLKSGEEDEMDLGASGITVSLKTVKNRMAKPKKIKFDISFVSGMNPYTGLDFFCTPERFDKIGIAQGKMEVDSDGVMTFKATGNRWYVAHLGKSVTKKQLFKKEVFTEDVLKKMEPFVSDYFRFKDLEELEDAEDEYNQMNGDNGEDIDENGFADADDIFS